jgi:hypothetical protein
MFKLKSFFTLIKTVILWCGTSHHPHQFPNYRRSGWRAFVAQSVSLRDFGIYLDADISMPLLGILL